MKRESVFRWAEFEPLCIIRALVRKAWLIVLAVLFGVMAVSVILPTFATRTYSSSATFVVTSRGGTSGGYANITAAREVVNIYSELLTSSYVDETITQHLDGLSGTISASQVGNTNLINVTVTSDTPKGALLTLQALIDQQSDLSDFISASTVLTLFSTPSVSVVVNRGYDSVRVSRLAGIGCGVLMAILILWLYLSYGTVQNRTGAKNNLDARIITSVPHQGRMRTWSLNPRKRTRMPMTVSSPAVSFAFAESIHRISARIEHEHSNGSQVFLLSSVSMGEGKSTITANAALSLAERSGKVLLIDLDLRRPVQHRIMNATVPAEADLSSLLAAGASAQELLDAAIVREDNGLAMLLAVKPNSAMVELLSSSVISELVALARKEFDYVIIDSPPLGFFADSEVLSDLADASVLVVRQDVVPAAEINDAIDSLRAGKSQFMGCVLNDVRYLISRPSDYGHNKYGKYGKYGYGSKYRKAVDN